jgi:uncharacterized protein (DUF983 family)
MVEPYYAPVSPFSTGTRCRCPRCGRGKLFKGILDIKEMCPSCHLDYSFTDAGDGPAVFVILIVGFLVAGGSLVVEVAYQPAYWVHAVLWGPMILILPIILLRPFKAILIAIQYHNQAREGRLDN